MVLTGGVQELTDIIIRAHKHGKKIKILVENLSKYPQKTYGELLQDELKVVLNSSNKGSYKNMISDQKLELLDFNSDNIEASFNKWKNIFEDPNNIVIMFGLGKHYDEVARQFYKKDKLSRAKMVGWMNSYKTDSTFRNGIYLFNLLIEITDLDLDAYGSLIARQRRDIIDTFINIYGDISPPLRDQAFSYDAGLAINASLELLNLTFLQPSSKKKYLELDNTMLKQYADRLGQLEIMGVTGKINFRDEGEKIYGGEGMDCTVFEKSTNSWKKIKVSDIYGD